MDWSWYIPMAPMSPDFTPLVFSLRDFKNDARITVVYTCVAWTPPPQNRICKFYVLCIVVPRASGFASRRSEFKADALPMSTERDSNSCSEYWRSHCPRRFALCSTWLAISYARRSAAAGMMASVTVTGTRETPRPWPNANRPKKSQFKLLRPNRML
jgi:hypothetical protein